MLSDRAVFANVCHQAQLVQARLLAIVAHLLVHHPLAPQAPLTRRLVGLSTVGRSLAGSHVISFASGNFSCSRCFRGRRVGMRTLNAWLEGPYVPDPALARAVAGGVRPTPLDPGTHVSVRGKYLHPSHPLAVYRGLFYCTACGRVSSQAVRALFLPCPGFALVSGRNKLRDISRGLLPWGMDAWPADRPLATVAFVQL